VGFSGIGAKNILIYSIKDMGKILWHGEKYYNIHYILRQRIFYPRTSPPKIQWQDGAGFRSTGKTQKQRHHGCKAVELHF